jgi:hypothetical protein
MAKRGRPPREGALLTDWQPQFSIEIDWECLEDLAGMNLPSWARDAIQAAAEQSTAGGAIVKPSQFMKVQTAIEELPEGARACFEGIEAEWVAVRQRLSELAMPVIRTATPAEVALGMVIEVFEQLGVKFTRREPIDDDDISGLQPALRVAWDVFAAAGVDAHTGSLKAFARNAVREFGPA